MDLRPDQTARRGESWRTPSTPRQNRPKVMRTNDRLGDSYRSLAPGLCGRRASRYVSAQDLHDLCSRTNALRLTRSASPSEPIKEAVTLYQKLSLAKHAGKTSNSVSTPPTALLGLRSLTNRQNRPGLMAAYQNTDFPRVEQLFEHSSNQFTFFCGPGKTKQVMHLSMSSFLSLSL